MEAASNLAVPASVTPPYSGDHEALTRLAAVADRVSLAAEEERTLDLRLARIPEK